MKNMNISYVSVDEIFPYENNPRFNDDAVEVVVKSIEEFGFRNPIIVDVDNVIVAGHTRLEAAKQLGMELVPVIKADDLTEEQVQAYRLVDNKTSEFADWDYDELLEELKDINDIDMELFGFSDELPEIDIGGMFDVGNLSEDGREYLKWVSGKVELDQEDINTLNTKLDQWEELDSGISFVTYLTEGG